MSIAERVSALVKAVGETVIVRQISASSFNTTTLQNSTTTNDTTVKAGVRLYKPTQIGGLVQQGDREVRIAASDLSIEPRPNDKIIIGSKTFNVVSVVVRKPRDVPAIYILQVRG